MNKLSALAIILAIATPASFVQAAEHKAAPASMEMKADAKDMKAKHVKKHAKKHAKKAKGAKTEAPVDAPATEEAK